MPDAPGVVMVTGEQASRRTTGIGIERLMLSEANYWFMLIADVVAAAVFLLVGIRLFAGGPLQSVVPAAVGCLSWGGIEYAVHRWVLHGPPSAVQRAHVQHHRDATALISAPAFLSTALALGVWAALSIPLTAGAAALVVGGLYAGYNYYALLHHVQHHHPRLAARSAWLSGLARAHRIHHGRQVVNYGVTTECWDRVFGSDDRSGRPSGRTRV